MHLTKALSMVWFSSLLVEFWLQRKVILIAVNKLKQYYSMFRFLIRAAIFYTIWQVIYDLFLLPNGKLDEFLSLSVVYISKTILNIFGWDIHSLGRIITINGYRGVEVLNECNALTLMVLYSGFIICFQVQIQPVTCQIQKGY